MEHTTPSTRDTKHAEPTIRTYVLAAEPERTPNQEPFPSPAGWDVAETSVEPTARTYYVVRVNGYPRATYAAETIQEAVDIAFPTDEARLEVAEVKAPDAGAARLMNPPMGWAGPFSVTELEARMRANAPRIEPDEPVTVIAQAPGVTYAIPPAAGQVQHQIAFNESRAYEYGAAVADALRTPPFEPYGTIRAGVLRSLARRAARHALAALDLREHVAQESARNERGARDPQLAVETRREEERAYTRSLHSVRKIAGVLAVAVAVAVAGLAGCHRKPESTLADVVTVAQYPDGTFSVDAYGPNGELLTSAHLAKDAKLADVFPVGCQSDDGDEPYGLSN